MILAPVHQQMLANISTVEDFEDWTRDSLRRMVPHAALLVTVGKLYGVGSIPTHRVSVDFPLDMIESLKNAAGALDDPLMAGWFRNEKLRYRNIEDVSECGEHSNWRQTLVRYGVKSVLIHGVLDHSARRFVVFQICNPCGGGSVENVGLLNALVPLMAESVWRAIGKRISRGSRALTGHPTLSLTSTELHIIELLAQGLSNKEIARRRGVSDSTVKTQVQRTGAKVGATRRAEIVALAMPMLSPLPPQSLIDYDDQ